MLGDVAYNDARESGGQMSFEETIANAMKELSQ
jgi:hypothetical protein